MIRIPGVLAQVEVDPSTDGMPGADLIQQLLNWAQMLALVGGSLAALLIGAAMYGLAREGGSYGGASRGKTLALGGVVGAILAGMSRRRRSTCCSRRRADEPPRQRTSILGTAIIATVIVVALVAGVILVRLGQGSRPSDDGNETPVGRGGTPRPTVACWPDRLATPLVFGRLLGRRTRRGRSGGRYATASAAVALLHRRGDRSCDRRDRHPSCRATAGRGRGR